MDKATIDYAAFRALAAPHMLQALYPAGGNTWSARGAQNLERLAAQMHDWVELVVCELALEANKGCPINKLPKEVLGIIFALVAHPEGVFRPEALLELEDVCMHWMEVVRGTPSFWTSIVIVKLAPDAAEQEQLVRYLAWRLRRAQGAPINLALDLCDETKCDRFAELVIPHMHHIRALELDIPEPVLAGEHLAAAALLSAPAPALAKLMLHSPSPGLTPGFDDPAPAPFLSDLLAGNAPALRHLFLNRICPPPPSWAPLRGLQRLEYVSRSPDIVTLAAAVLACPELRVLSVHLDRGLQLPAEWPADLRPPHAPDGPLSVTLSATTAPLASALSFLARIGRQHAQQVFCHVLDEDACARWLLREMAATRAAALHLGDHGNLPHGCISATATAFGAAGERRASMLAIPGLSAFESDVFGALRELTIGEALWPEGPAFPALPRLQTLTVGLQHAQHAWDGMTGIFLLPLAPGHAWALPALRALRIAYAERWGRRDILPGPLVVSAVDVALFLVWNLHTDAAIELVLQNVLLLEKPGTPWRRRVDQLVQQPGAILQPAYVPVPCPAYELLSAVHPW
ncbi:hypothetical protein AURDEDRAFT_184138 [Auricularia subglabra TFB-10046 SS5]|nr:hypothetical protein AURDEDRAFT_184138 [Auricularia subglabra TFB-10046 SS5]